MRVCDSGRGGTCAQSGKLGEVWQVLGSFEEFSMAAAEMPALRGRRVRVAAGEVGRGPDHVTMGAVHHVQEFNL